MPTDWYVVSLQATITARASDGLQMEFVLQNAGEEPVDVTFPTGECVRITVSDSDSGNQCWDSSEGRAFTQALVERTLEPGELITHEATWHDPPAGTYDIEATLQADQSVVAETTVSVP